jgi:hypothetical protein
MIIRTWLLAACMIVVPGLALCSHHLPPEIRAAARCDIWQPVASRVESWFSASGECRPADPPATSPPGWDGAAAGPPSTAVTAADDRTTTAVERLTALGAAAIDCRPLEADRRTHVASCRIAMDAAGQLHRVFQAPGSSPEEATAALTAQVEAWQQRLALRAVAAGASSNAP